MTITEIKNLIDDTVETNSTTFPDARKVRFINKAQDELVNLILEHDSLAQYDDWNYNDLSEGYIDLVSGVNDYDITQDENLAETLYTVKVLAKNAQGQYQELEKVGPNDDDVESSLAETATGSPTHYRVTGKRVIVSPTPNYASANGLKLLVQRKPQAVTTSDTTKELGIPSTFHQLVADMASYYYARAKVLVIRNEILNSVNEQKERLGFHVSSQDKDANTEMTAHYEQPE